jgi:phage gpG-like protein
MRRALAASPRVLAKVAAALKVAALGELGDEFRGSRDPWGRSWEPLAHRLGQPLLDSGRLRASFRPFTKETPTGLRVGTEVAYAAIHQFGGTIERKPGVIERFRGKKGKFVKSKNADKRGVTLASMSHGAYKIRIPARPMLPIGAGATASLFWRALQAAAKRVVERYAASMGGK